MREENRVESARLDGVKAQINQRRFGVLPRLRATLATIPKGAARDPIRAEIQGEKAQIDNLIRVKEGIRAQIQERRASISALQDQLTVG